MKLNKKTFAPPINQALPLFLLLLLTPLDGPSDKRYQNLVLVKAFKK